MEYFQKKNGIIIKLILHCIIPILVGLSIYVLFRGINIIDSSRKTFPLFQFRPADFILYNIPDGLWLYSFLSSIAIIWKNNSSLHFKYWILIAIVLSFLSEFLQIILWLPGTFDLLDLLVYIMATTIFLVNFRFTISIISPTSK